MPAADDEKFVFKTEFFFVKKIVFVLPPESEPILLDGMKFNDLKAQFEVPIYDLDVQEFMSKILL